MFSILGFLTCQSKLPMNYKHLRQVERYQIYALMIAGHDQTQIAKLLDRTSMFMPTRPEATPDFLDKYCGCASWSLQRDGLESSSIELALCNFLLNINPKLQLAVAAQALSL